MSVAPAPQSDPGLSAATADLESVVSLTQELVRTPSRAGIDSYEPAIALVETQLRSTGLEPVRLVDDGGAVGVTCEVSGDRPGPRYVLDACLDTAPYGDEAAWSHPPTSAVIDNGWLYGRGSSDSKVAIAMFCHIAARLAHDAGGVAGSLALVFDCDEHTGGFRGIKRYLETVSEAPAGVMIGYPGLDAIVVGGRGVLRAELTVHGVAGHSGSSSVNDGNAVAKASLLARELAEVDVSAGGGGDFGVAPRLTVTAMHGGEATGSYTVVPDLCRVHVDVRLTPNFNAEAAESLLSGIVDRVDRQVPTPQATTVTMVGEAWPPYRLAPDHELTTALASSARRFGLSPRMKVAGPSNIGNYLSSVGIPATAGFGVAYRNLHGTDEVIEVATIPVVQATYQAAVTELLSPHRRRRARISKVSAAD